MSVIGLFTTSQVLAEIPRGIFSLSNSDRAAKDTVLTDPNVAGISVRYGWAGLEPVEGQFNWTFLDSEVSRAAAAGKKVLLRIATQAGKPAWVTQAITAAGGQFFTFDDDGVTTTIPVFWDPTYLAKKIAMIRALGAHFTNNPTVVVVTASFANATSEDWNVPHATSEVQQWLSLGYTSEKMLDAGKQIIDATMEAFPNQYVALAIGGNGHVGGQGVNLDPDASYVARNAILAAKSSWPNRLIVQINSLSTYNPAPPAPEDSVWRVLWDNRPDVAAQMAWWVADEPTYRINGGVPGNADDILQRAIDLGASYGTNYIEIYQTDVLNLTNTIGYGRSVLLSNVAAPVPPSGLRILN